METKWENVRLPLEAHTRLVDSTKSQIPTSCQAKIISFELMRTVCHIALAIRRINTVFSICNLSQPTTQAIE